ncbi:MAG TPA: hypothetical protein PLF38_05275 [Xylanibacter oryzae]|uniref:hypothetical protein n=1 Tax=Xylanibacter oryzae TaxID=185293 RepID=UPI000563B662|nr:hypothetical protein [Xylanibacter oryzae]MBP7358240.1 hypothetical protein [Prevotella sp.]HRN16450.1 hypothetical protein [Xylanibacter oryzae]
MTVEEKTLALFETRVRELIMAYDSQKSEQHVLEKKIIELESQIKQLSKELTQAQNDYQSLKMARMIEVSDGDLDSTRKKINGLIKTVDKCITMLNDD